MKKILFAVLTLALLLALFIPATAAEDRVTVTLTPSATTYYPGQSVVLTIKVSSTVEYTSIGYKPAFDSNVFEFVKYTKNPSAPFDMNKYDSGKNNLMLVTEFPTKYSGVLGEITFKVKDVLPSTKSFGGTVVYSNSEENINQVSGKVVESQIQIECDHDFLSADCIMGTGENAGIHYQECAKGCGEIKKEAHDWGEGIPNPAPTCTEPGKLVSKCLFCDAYEEEYLKALGHAWDNECDSSCNNCGNTREITHQYDTVLTGDATNHWYKCSLCDAIKKEAHSWDEGILNPAPTCTEPGKLIFICSQCQARREEDKNALGHAWDNKCDTTCNNCGSTREITHQYETLLTGDATNHWYKCSICDAIKKEKHNWIEGEFNPAPTCTEPGKLIFICSYCQAHKEEDKAALGHAWDNECDTTCNNCGSTREITHQYETVLTGDATGHWYKCSLCGIPQSAPVPHTPGPEPTEDASQNCTECHFELKPILPHVHVMSTIWYHNGSEHWHRCEKYGCDYTEDNAAHDFDNNCDDVDCNTCGEVCIPPHNFNPVWKGLKDGHYHTCIDCNAQSEIYPHTPGPEATQDTKQLCTDCNYIIKWELSHVHSYPEAWHSDDTNHWKICNECMEATLEEEHLFTSTVITKEPTETEAGSRQHICSTCKKQVTEILPALGSESTVPSTSPVSQDTTAPNVTNSEDSGRFPWEIAGIAAVLLLLIGIVLLLIEFLRSRRINMRGKYSK